MFHYLNNKEITKQQIENPVTPTKNRTFTYTIFLRFLLKTSVYKT